MSSALEHLKEIIEAAIMVAGRPLSKADIEKLFDENEQPSASDIQTAIQTYGIHYPVAQDNNFATWNAYKNEYWPAEYLIDKKGNVQRTYFGEGEYDKTELAIQMLLKQ